MAQPSDLSSWIFRPGILESIVASHEFSEAFPGFNSPKMISILARRGVETAPLIRAIYKELTEPPGRIVHNDAWISLFHWLQEFKESMDRKAFETIDLRGYRPSLYDRVFFKLQEWLEALGRFCKRLLIGLAIILAILLAIWFFCGIATSIFQPVDQEIWEDQFRK